MSTDIRENLLNWLRDAHAMEQQAEQMLKAQAARIENYPEIRARIEQHLEETMGQQRLLETCLERHGTSDDCRGAATLVRARLGDLSG